METTIKERIVQFLKYKNLGQGKFEKAVGLSNGYISNLKSSPTADKLLMIISAYPELNKNWLLTGEGDMLNNNSDQSALPEEVESTEVEEVPVLSVELARKPDTDIVQYIHANKDTVEHGSIDAYFPSYDILFRSMNDGMSPYISKGDIMALRKVPKDAIIENEVYLIDTPSGCYVRRVVMDGDVLVGKSSHPAYKELRVRLDDVYNVLLVVIVVKFSFTPSPITLDDLHKRDDTIERLNTKNDALFDELVKYGDRIDQALKIASRAQDQLKDEQSNYSGLIR